MDANEKWYSVKEVAGKLGVSVDSVRRWIRRGLLRAFKMPVRSIGAYGDMSALGSPRAISGDSATAIWHE